MKQEQPKNSKEYEVPTVETVAAAVEDGFGLSDYSWPSGGGSTGGGGDDLYDFGGGSDSGSGFVGGDMGAPGDMGGGSGNIDFNW